MIFWLSTEKKRPKKNRRRRRKSIDTFLNSQIFNLELFFVLFFIHIIILYVSWFFSSFFWNTKPFKRINRVTIITAAATAIIKWTRKRIKRRSELTRMDWIYNIIIINIYFQKRTNCKYYSLFIYFACDLIRLFT